MGDTVQVNQFCLPLCYDLAGKTFHLVMDNTEDNILHFLDEENLQIAAKGDNFTWENYAALKADATTYFVHVKPAKYNDFMHFIFILDTAQQLVTKVTVQEAYDPEHPRLMQVIPYFGAIAVPGMELPTIRHHLSKRMAGEHIYWHYNSDFRIQHIYHTPTSIRVGVDSVPTEVTFDKKLHEKLEEPLLSDDPEVRRQAAEKIEAHKALRERYPFYEEPALHIWINDHLNLFSFIEENLCRCSDNFSAGGGGMVVLQDIDRLLDLGLCFNPANYRYSDTYLVTAFGERNNNGDSIDNIPSPYDWSQITGMPSIRWEIPED